MAVISRFSTQQQQQPPHQHAQPAPQQQQQPQHSQQQRSQRRSSSSFLWTSTSTWILILSTLSILSLVGNQLWHSILPSHSNSNYYSHELELLFQPFLSSSSTSSTTAASTATATATTSPPPATLPVVVVLDSQVDDLLQKTNAARQRRQQVGGGGLNEPKHVGGHSLTIPWSTFSPAVNRALRETWNVQSVLDVGCGLGYSAAWWQYQAIPIQCVEGSPSAVSNNVLPADRVVSHDFTRGPWWPSPPVDVAMVYHVLQHISRPYESNVLAALTHGAALILVTIPSSPHDSNGWHVVEVHAHEYWIQRLSWYGLLYEEALTMQLRTVARQEMGTPSLVTGKPHHAHHIAHDLLVFVNPPIMIQKSHLLPALGCVKNVMSNYTVIHRPCGTGAGMASESTLPSSHVAKPFSLEQQQVWEQALLQRLLLATTEATEATEATTAAATGSESNNNTVLIPLDQPPPPPQQQPSNKIHQHHVVTQLSLGNLTALPVGRTIPVVVWPLFEFGAQSAEALHLYEYGLKESSFLELSSDRHNELDPNTIWIGDTGYAYGWNVWCGKFMEHLVVAQQRRIEAGLSSSWPVYIVDWTDGAGHQRCVDVEQLVGKEFVHYSERSIVQGRHWNAVKQWVDHGFLMPRTVERDGAVYYQHTPLYVRTDTVDSLQSLLKSKGMKLDAPIERYPKSVDVTHLWPLELSLVGGVESKLRSHVSRTIAHLGNNNAESNNSNSTNNSSGIQVFVGLAGDPVRAGRRGVKSSYLEALLATKIIVVTQRDGWEDHYRLFEALVSGSMVLHDRMLSLPASLTNGTSLVEYTSQDDLVAKIHYYLSHDDERIAIAREGRRVAMEQNRAWHRMEEVIFGKILTKCVQVGDGGGGGTCPFIVHAAEGLG